MVLEHANARYTIPNYATVSPGMRQLLAETLKQDPRERISSADLWSKLEFMRTQRILQSQQ